MYLLPAVDILDGKAVRLSKGDYNAVTTYNDENNSFWAESGRGFGRDGGIRPDMAAPGVDIPTITGRMTGSSMAAALTAGAAAQFMQWAVVEHNDEYVFGRDVCNYLIRGAIREEDITSARVRL